jgi:hypothetical protein
MGKGSNGAKASANGASAPINKLYFGDNLDWLPRIDSESVDLVYLDPPFNSNANYSVLFRSPVAEDASAQIQAFEDTWSWGNSAEASLDRVRELNLDTFKLLDALRRTFLGESDIMAYLAMMAPRLLELRRVMKPNATLYLHCDPTASHYLKILLDCVFEGKVSRMKLAGSARRPRLITLKALCIIRACEMYCLFFGEMKTKSRLSISNLSNMTRAIFHRNTAYGIRMVARISLTILPAPAVPPRAIQFMKLWG